MRRSRYWTARWWHDWEPFVNRSSRWNWIDFTFFSFTVEWADYASPHVWEIHLGVLGVHVEFIRVDREKAEALQSVVREFSDRGDR